MRLICNLKALRQDANLSLTDIEEASGVNRGTLSAIENGRALPHDKDVPLLELAYRASASQWWPPEQLLLIQADLAEAHV